MMMMKRKTSLSFFFVVVILYILFDEVLYKYIISNIKLCYTCTRNEIIHKSLNLNLTTLIELHIENIMKEEKKTRNEE